MYGGFIIPVDMISSDDELGGIPYIALCIEPCVFVLFVLAEAAVVMRGIALGLHESPTKKRRMILTSNPDNAEPVVSWQVVSTLTMRCV